MTIPSREQRLSRDFVETIKIDQARGEAVPGEDLLFATEQRMGPLPPDLRELFPAFSIPAVPRKGRPRNDRGVEDFGMLELDRRYAILFRTFRSENDAKSGADDDGPPSERAYRQLASEMSDVFKGIDWLALRNKHSAWKTGRFYSFEKVADSEDFDANIERQFPAPE
jgi:hypothetical protein